MARILRKPKAFYLDGEESSSPWKHKHTLFDVSPIPICVRTVEEAENNIENKITIAPDISLETACEIAKLKWMKSFALIYVTHPEIIYVFKEKHPWANVHDELSMCLLASKKEVLIDVLKKRGADAFPNGILKKLLKDKVLTDKEVGSALNEFTKENIKIRI